MPSKDLDFTGEWALLIPQTRNNLWTFYSQSETLDTLLCLSSLTNSLACWCKPSPAQTGDCSYEALKTLKETQNSGALTPQTPHSHRRTSQLPCQPTAFVCPLRGLNCPTEWTRPRWLWCSSEEGVGSRTEHNSMPSLCEQHKRASESGEVRVRQLEPCTDTCVQQTWGR